MLKPELDYMISSNISTKEIDNLFDSLRNLDIEVIPEVKTFLYSYKDRFLIDMEVFVDFYNLQEYCTLVNFLENFEELFTDKEKELLRNYFLENNEKMAQEIIDKDLMLYTFEEEKNKFSDLMDYFNLSDKDIGYTLSGLEEKYAELMSDDADEIEYDNQLSNKEKEICVQHSEEMTDSEIIEMFEELK